MNSKTDNLYFAIMVLHIFMYAVTNILDIEIPNSHHSQKLHEEILGCPMKEYVLDINQKHLDTQSL